MKKSFFTFIAVVPFIFLSVSCKDEIAIEKREQVFKSVEIDSTAASLFGQIYTDSSGYEISNDPTLIEPQELICGTTVLPKYLKDLTSMEVYTHNVSLKKGASLKAYGFSGEMGKKDFLLTAYFTKYKDYTCGKVKKRAAVGLKLYVHASQVDIKTSSPTLPMIAAAVELGMAKAECKFQTFGINPDKIYSKLPSAQFSVETYSKVISAYDEIVHSLKDSTLIDPTVSDTPKF